MDNINKIERERALGKSNIGTALAQSNACGLMLLVPGLTIEQANLCIQKYKESRNKCLKDLSKGIYDGADNSSMNMINELYDMSCIDITYEEKRDYTM